MDEQTYREQLLEILRQKSEQAVSKLRGVEKALPEMAQGLHIGIHPAQEPDGSFSIWVHAQGPNLYALNNAISENRLLFDGFANTGISDPRTRVPSFDPFNQDFEVNDVIVQVAFCWLREVWASFGGLASGKSADVFGEEDWGDIGLKRLRP
ncbi:DUF6389 family protein [Leisingera sp. S132]|uniref:DUF6389 family protein n=1 Tax=Leisingera sp. S132 TaxID=2867016 RepID=UPI0021A711E5|nr:DUF6389 family protein [Leisingera sp. S132]UWQ78842.1 DUF6389 family protein [Leisingera sp. S132]